MLYIQWHCGLPICIFGLFICTFVVLYIYIYFVCIKSWRCSRNIEIDIEWIARAYQWNCRTIQPILLMKFYDTCCRQCYKSEAIYRERSDVFSVDWKVVPVSSSRLTFYFSRKRIGWWFEGLQKRRGTGTRIDTQYSPGSEQTFRAVERPNRT